ncbi:MAG: hypothetical protein U9N47_03730 [Thermodesulfobacteriota bacterium]|nr:hypothetical protein [Thermodesulfobacteriota bacterium]
MKGQASRSGAGDDAGERSRGREVRNDFRALVQTIARIHGELAEQTTRAVNTGLRLRNWTAGMHIAKCELNGADKGRYGEKLFQVLAEKLSAESVSNCSRRMERISSVSWRSK